VNKIIGSMAFYFFQYLDGPLQYLLEGDYPEYRIGLKDTSDWIGRDRYYFSRYFFFTLQFIRLWIFKESYLFLIFHLLFLYYFLFDLHLFYTYCYLLTLQISRIIFFLSDEELKFDKYLREWYKALRFADDLAHDKEDIYPVKPIPQGHIFKLTLNNIELSLYFSLYHFSRTQPYLKGNERYKYRYLSFMVVCCDFLNYITYLRPNIFQDRFLSVKRNKYKYLYFFILFIMIIEYYIPTVIIRNTW